MTQDEKQPNEDLEEAFDEVLPSPNWYISNDGEDAYNVKQMKEMFCAGVNWQKEQDKAIIERAEDHAKLAGIALGEKEAKEKFINKACEWLHRCIDVDDEVKMIDDEPEAKSFIQKNIHRIEVANKIVEEFKKAMEDE